MPSGNASSRPDPDALLARLGQVSAAAASGGPGEKARGRLKIFFGMAPGVGKTYAMLAAAQRMAAQGVDVAVGVVETHGRAETERMLLGLDVLPRRSVAYQGTVLSEFDSDAAIARRPDILLVDELAHTNAPGSARQKRWQDVEACLRAGVNVYTTVNVQHLESLNDVIAQITGVRVTESIPDGVFDRADEVELVDLPPDALHERLREGKVYLGEHASRAVDPSDGFFRKGNLTALRELALRRTAAWVDLELRRYKQDRGIHTVWPAGERIVVAVSPSPMSARLIRAAKRMAAGLHADLFAVHVETPRTARLSGADRERLAANLRLAESLGATTVTLAGSNAARELLEFSRSRNVGRIVVGKSDPMRARWKEFAFGSFVDDLIRESGEIDIYVVRGDDEGSEPSTRAEAPAQLRERHERLRGYASATLLVAAVTSVGLAVFSRLNLSNVAMVYLAAVVVAALWLGRGPAMLAAVLAVAAFDFFFVPPQWTFAVSDAEYLVTFAVMLGVGVVVATLAAKARENALRALDRERFTASHYALARALGAARDTTEVAGIVARHAHDLLHADVVVCVPRRHGAAGTGPTLDVVGAADSPDWFDDPHGRERGVAQWAIDHGRASGRGTTRLPSAQGRYLPLIGTGGTVGLIGVRALKNRPVGPNDGAMLESIVTMAASALERVSLGEAREAARIEAERERLRSALLSSVSHDLRTPLAAITGAASTLEQAVAIDDRTRSELLRAIMVESVRLNDIIANLVFATRLESGGVALRREWTTLEEVIGVGLARHREALAGRPFRTHIPADLPMIYVDNAMLPQVVHNLIENALRYSPPGTPLGITAWATENQVVVKVWDEGQGLAEDENAKVFERFYRGRASRSAAQNVTANAATGMGLGLTICDGIVRAHGGRIWAEPNTPRGVGFLFSIPLERSQPAMPDELAYTADGSTT